MDLQKKIEDKQAEMEGLVANLNVLNQRRDAIANRIVQLQGAVEALQEMIEARDDEEKGDGKAKKGAKKK